MGVTRSGPVKANSGVRARVPAAGKGLEGNDGQMTNLYYLLNAPRMYMYVYASTGVQCDCGIIATKMPSYSTAINIVI